MLEAARIDGAGEFRTFLLIVLPMSKPILAVQVVLTFIAGWNSFLWPLIIANDQKLYTLSVGLSLLNQQLAVNPSLQMAASTVMVVPDPHRLHRLPALRHPGLRALRLEMKWRQIT